MDTGEGSRRDGTLAIGQALKAEPYPGRGLLLGCSPDGQRAVALYFITGRSPHSLNRVFRTDAEGLRIEPFDPSLAGDRSLTIYRPLREGAGWLIVGNGDQTDTVLEALEAGGSFEGALRTRRFEPDAPHFTPRVTGIIGIRDRVLGCRLSLIRAAGGGACERFFFEYDIVPGVGHLLHTYRGEGEPLPAFCGEPAQIAVPGDLGAFAREAWESLAAERRVALYALGLRFSDGSREEVLINRHRGEGAPDA